MLSHNIWGSEKGSDVSGNFSNDHGVAFSFSSELLKFSLIVDIGKSVMIFSGYCCNDHQIFCPFSFSSKLLKSLQIVER
jgi:hypothetical protein